MKVSFENPDKINALLSITVEEADYKADVEKTLKDYRKRANIPGFRPGQAPMGMIKRQYGESVKMDALNKLIGKTLQDYITENKVRMLGEPLASEKQEAQDLSKEAPYTFMFDIAVAPEFDIALDEKDTITYYDIKADDALIDRQVESIASRAGNYVKSETFGEKDMMRGDLRELDAEGNTKEDGITVEAAVLMPAYFKSEDQKKLFEGAKAGDIVTFNPSKAYEGGETEVAALLKIKKEELAGHEGDFSYQITDIEHFENHAIDQELFDRTFGEGVVKSEEEFRAKIAADLQKELVMDSDFKFLKDVRAYAENKVGQLTYPDALLKRIMLQNNKDKGADFVDQNYEASLKELTWSLIRNRLVEQAGVKVNDDDVKAVARETARMQFAQYGMTNVPEEYIDRYADDLLKKQETVDNIVERAIDKQLVASLKGVVKLKKKKISLDDFNKMMDEK